MNEPENRDEAPDELDGRYRRASAATGEGPSERTRAAILAHARELAASRRAAPLAGGIAGAGRAANDPHWKLAAFASLAVAALALLVWLPHEPDVRPGTSLSDAPAAAAPAAGAPAAQAFPREVEAPGPRATGIAAEPRAEPKSPRPEVVIGAARAPLPAAPSAARPALAAEPAEARGAASERAKAAAAPAPAAQAADPVVPQSEDTRPARRAASAGAPAAQLAPRAAMAPMRAPALASLSPSLIDAARAGASERVAMLLRAGAPVDARDADGRTALAVAAGGGELAVVRLLLAAGADAAAADRDGLTAIDHARAHGHDAVVQLLEALGTR